MLDGSGRTCSRRLAAVTETLDSQLVLLDL